MTDERGKQRFHGAFTGGFSAGYFNSVGTKEGWAPASFKSSRSDRAKQAVQPASAEDFMDDEDFNEHGIAPKQVKVRAEYREVAAVAGRGSGLEAAVRPARGTVGARMLMKMGWREGQGVGPRIKRRLRRMKRKTAGPQARTYGVALPSGSEGDSDGEEDEMLVSNFDVDEFRFEVKEDVFGLGYKRLDVAGLLSRGYCALFLSVGSVPTAV